MTIRVLLDTHFVIWSVLDPGKLKPAAKAILRDTRNEIFVSSVSLWEISLKYAVKKFNLENIPLEGIVEAVEKTGFEIIPLEKHEAATFHRLPRISNKDPFDRMLAWQCICRNLSLMSIDSEIAEYEKSGLRLFVFR